VGAATDEVALLSELFGGRRTALDLRTLGVRWALDERHGSVLAAGAGHLVESVERTAFRRLNPATGAVAQVYEPGPAPRFLDAEEDQAALLLEDREQPRIVLFDLVRGVIVKTFGVGSGIYRGHMAGPTLYIESISPDGTTHFIDVRDRSTGARINLRQFPVSSPPDESNSTVFQVDGSGVVLRCRDRVFTIERDASCEANVSRLSRAVAHHCAFGRFVAAFADGVELVDLGRGGTVWRALVRQDGYLDVVIAGAHVWVAHVDRSENQLEVSAFEITSGLRIRRDLLQLRRGGPPVIVPLDGSIVTLVAEIERDAGGFPRHGIGSMVALRLEDCPSSPRGLLR
jgi:hypothetical protein